MNVTVPAWVGAAEADRAAASMLRQLRGTSAAWGTLLAKAQTIVSAFEEFDGDIAALHDPRQAQELLAAPRILDASANELSQLAPHERQALAIEAAMAFGMAGNFPSARAALHSGELDVRGAPPAIRAAIASAVPQEVRELLDSSPAHSPEDRYIESLATFLRSGSGEDQQQARQSLDACLASNEDPWHSKLLRCARVCFANVSGLASAKNLRRYVDLLPDGFLDRLLGAGNLVLLPSQYEAIDHRGLLESAHNVAIALPTGTGKTLLGELCLAHGLGRNPGIVCYVAPYVALGRQAFEMIRRHFPPGVRVRQLLGSYQETEPVDPLGTQEVVVATPERFDALLRTQADVLQALRVVVVDEAHIIESGQRGVRVEGLLTRLRMAQRQKGAHMRLVLLSAVLSNTQQIEEWLDVESGSTIEGS